MPPSQPEQPLSHADPIAAFEEETRTQVEGYRADSAWRELSLAWLARAGQQRYTHNFSCLGRPLIQLPTDIVAFQEIVWRVRPDLILETGIAHGGSLIASAMMLSLLDYADAVAAGELLDPAKPKRRVLGVDIDIRAHNRAAIEAHPMSGRIDMIQGSSVDPATIEAVRLRARGHERILVCLDSNHTHEHVLAELEAYAPLVTPGSYCIVWDTAVEDMKAGYYADRPWGPGNSPKSAVWEYQRRLGEGRRAEDGGALHFELDRRTEDKLMITVAPDGFLKRV